MKQVCILIVLTWSGFHSLAQQLSKSDLKKANNLAEEAQAKFDLDDYYSAYQLYRQALAIDPLHEKAGVNSAICIFQLRYSTDSLNRLEDNLTVSKVPDASYYLALIKHQQKKFDEAILLLHAYKKVKPAKRLHSNVEADYRIQQNKNAKHFLDNPTEAFITNMGPAINGPGQDYVPVLTLDESMLYFTSKRKKSENDVLNADMSYLEDIYVSQFINNEWSPAKNLGPPINSETNDACVALSPDGERMIIYRTSENIESGDLYISKKGAHETWQSPEKLPEIINSPFIETSACFSTDTGEIFFSSNRPGGFGGKDLYRIRKLPNQKWSRAFNLGPKINTLYDEDAPFLHPDGVSLYFSSKGHNSMGGYDLFSSEYNQEENTFSKPENLAYPINGIHDDIFFMVSLDGKRGYYSSEKADTYGLTDIYKIDTRFKSKELVVQTGTVVTDGQNTKAKLSVYEWSDNKLQGIYTSNANTGHFILAINPFKTYKLVVDAEGYEELELKLDALVTQSNATPLELKLKRSNGQ